VTNRQELRSVLRVIATTRSAWSSSSAVNGRERWSVNSAPNWAATSATRCETGSPPAVETPADAAVAGAPSSLARARQNASASV
jgi:hypothetical protein